MTAIWGSTFIVNRLALETAPPLVFILVRFSLAGVVLYVFTRGRPRTPNLARDSAVIGVLLAIGIGSQITGQLFTTASKAAFVTGLSVPLTPVAGYLMTKKKPSRENLAGPRHVYPRFATRAAAETMLLGASVQARAAEDPPAARTSSSAIWQPVCPLPTTRTAPGGSDCGLRYSRDGNWRMEGSTY